MGEEELNQLIRGCKKQDAKCQNRLYKAFYRFSMEICRRYALNRDDAADAMNLGFFKLFTHMESFDVGSPFKPWLRKIMVNTSIDSYRTGLRIAYTEDLDKAEHISDGALIDTNLNYNDVLTMIQQLPNTCRVIFNLFAIEGYSHDEIASMLNINSGTSKSSLHKARQKLRKMIIEADHIHNHTLLKIKQ